MRQYLVTKENPEELTVESFEVGTVFIAIKRNGLSFDKPIPAIRGPGGHIIFLEFQTNGHLYDMNSGEYRVRKLFKGEKFIAEGE